MAHSDHGGLAGENHNLYKVWHSMLARCNNSMHRQYKDYGGRGITVSPEWIEFKEFFRWAYQSGFDGKKTIDRVENDKGYSPENCRWADKKTQARNRRSNVRYEYDGESKTLPEWADIYGIKVITLVCRVKRMGWSMHRALNERTGKYDHEITALGKTQKLSEWAQETGMPKDRIYLRIKRGWPADRAVSEGASI